MADSKPTVASLAKQIDELQEQLNEINGQLNDQIGALESRVDALEDGGDQRKKRGRNMTPEQRKAAGERLQMARAKNLGLDSIEQLRALKLRPGAKPTKKQIAQVKKDFPA